MQARNILTNLSPTRKARPDPQLWPAKPFHPTREVIWSIMKK